MKIQIDTQAKTIKLEQSAKLSELNELLEKFLPNGEWKEYTLETNTIINNWAAPIIIDRWRPWHNPYYGSVQYLTGGTYTQSGLTGGLQCATTNVLKLNNSNSILNIETN